MVGGIDQGELQLVAPPLEFLLAFLKVTLPCLKAGGIAGRDSNRLKPAQAL